MQRTRTHALIVTAMLGWPLSSGCSSSDAAESSTGDTEAQIEAHLAERARLICEGLAGCCAQAKRPHDVNACRDLLAGPVPFGAHFDAGAAAECLSEIAAAYSQCPPAAEPEVCARVVTGTAALGESCGSQYSCALVPGESVRCSIETHTCQKLVPVQEGRPCDYEASDEWSNCSVTVDPDFYCDYDTNTCRKRPGLGGTCTAEADCSPDQTCAGGSCVARVAIGGDCSATPCIPSAHCDDSKLCVADKAIGDACENGSECPNDHCDVDTKVCASLAPAGICVD